jgi:hypothetical protein
MESSGTHSLIVGLLAELLSEAQQQQELHQMAA